MNSLEAILLFVLANTTSQKHFQLGRAREGFERILGIG
jgi:hypothetical protein